jgi:hypothetical protein
MDFNTAMNAYIQDLQKPEKSKVSKLAEQRAFSILVLASLRADVQRVEDDIVRTDKEILALTDQNQEIDKIKANRISIIAHGEMISITELSSLIAKLKDDKKQLEKNPTLAAATIEMYTEDIKIYCEVYQRRMQRPVVDTELA